MENKYILDKNIIDKIIDLLYIIEPLFDEVFISGESQDTSETIENRKLFKDVENTLFELLEKQNYE